ncbi:SRPBCC family protein [Microbacterium sp. BK668]|uniref:SRPBCC family protein n=1 Tax=Microbacterium sp. BK668 TaxID=2512118 RepID=UPI00105CEF0F|nr:SRPBCC family protein [Microbacterium sp. BK668]TDN92299.1 polyketide cyclase/dehydrase/lipid transport protein [Microbacterium sp. BK668]
MFTVTETISIRRPAQEVFDFLTDARSRSRWDGSVVFEELTSALPVRVGTTIHSRVRAMGRESDFHWRITEFDPPTRVATVSTSGPVPTTVVMDFVASGIACDVRATIEGRPGGLMRFVEPMIEEMVRTNLTTGFARAREILEADGSRG